MAVPTTLAVRRHHVAHEYGRVGQILFGDPKVELRHSDLLFQNWADAPYHPKPTWLLHLRRYAPRVRADNTIEAVALLRNTHLPGRLPTDLRRHAIVKALATNEYAAVRVDSVERHTWRETSGVGYRHRYEGVSGWPDAPSVGSLIDRNIHHLAFESESFARTAPATDTKVVAILGDRMGRVFGGARDGSDQLISGFAPDAEGGIRLLDASVEQIAHAVRA